MTDLRETLDPSGYYLDDEEIRKGILDSGCYYPTALRRLALKVYKKALSEKDRIVLRAMNNILNARPTTNLTSNMLQQLQLQGSILQRHRMQILRTEGNYNSL